MQANSLLVVLCAASLGATCWLVASRPTGDDVRVAELERKLAAAEARAAASESLRTELRDMKEHVDRRLSDLDRRAAATQAAQTAPSRADASGPRTAPQNNDSAIAKPLEDMLAEKVDKKVAEKLDALAARDKERGEDGKWKAPIDELVLELKLNDQQKADAVKTFDRMKDGAFELLKSQRADGGCLLDDFADQLKSGVDPGEATRQLFARVIKEKAPGTDQTYLTHFIELSQAAEEQLGKQIDKDQMKKFKSLRVDIGDVKTGYDPVGDYIRARVQ